MCFLTTVTKPCFPCLKCPLISTLKSSSSCKAQLRPQLSRSTLQSSILSTYFLWISREEATHIQFVFKSYWVLSSPTILNSGRQGTDAIPLWLERYDLAYCVSKQWSHRNNGCEIGKAWTIILKWIICPTIFQWPVKLLFGQNDKTETQRFVKLPKIIHYVSSRSQNWNPDLLTSSPNPCLHSAIWLTFRSWATKDSCPMISSQMKIQTRKLRIIISSNFFQDISKEAVNNQKLSIPGNTHCIMSQRRKPEGKGGKKAAHKHFRYWNYQIRNIKMFNMFKERKEGWLKSKWQVEFQQTNVLQSFWRRHETGPWP